MFLSFLAQIKLTFGSVFWQTVSSYFWEEFQRLGLFPLITVCFLKCSLSHLPLPMSQVGRVERKCVSECLCSHSSLVILKSSNKLLYSRTSETELLCSNIASFPNALRLIFAYETGKYWLLEQFLPQLLDPIQDHLFSCHVYLVEFVSNLQSLFFVTLTFLKSMGPLFVQNGPQFGFVWLLPHDSGNVFTGKTIT